LFILEEFWNGLPDHERKPVQTLLHHDIKLLSSLAHPNIVGFHGICVDWSGAASLLLHEFATMRDLSSFLEGLGRKLTLPEFLGFCFEILLGLSYLHNQSPPLAVIHGNLRPAKVFVFDNGSGWVTLKVGDVGVSTARVCDMSVTTVRGFNRLIAPEVATSRLPTVVSDLYSFGVMMINIAHQHVCTRSDHVANVGVGLESNAAEIKDGVLNEIETAGFPRVADLLSRCLEVEPQDRPESANDCLSELIAAASVIPAFDSLVLSNQSAIHRGDVIFTWFGISEPVVISDCRL
jgi:serine/threonine protein kinase